MTREQAIKLLGLIEAEAGSVRIVRAAWARRNKEIHPDTSDNETYILTAGPNIAALREARDLLLDAIAQRNSACKLCGGHGTIVGRLGRKTCVACNGTGEAFR